MTKTEYIQKMYAILVPMCSQYGYHNVAAGMIAQSIQEGWNSGLATKYFNYWGMKAGKSYKGKTVAMNNKAGNDPAVYRVYTSMANGCEGYFIFLSYPRYQPLKACTTDIEYLDKIGPCGWNSNPGYGKRCQAHLKEVYEALGQAPVSERWQVGKTYITTQDLNIRKEPSTASDTVPYYDLTEDAKKHSFVSTNGNTVLKRGTRVTVKDIKQNGTSTWVRVPSGWLCAKNSKNTYVS